MIRLIFGNPLNMFLAFVTAMLCILFVTQIFLPLWHNRPLFPILSRKPAIKNKIRGVNEELDEEELRAQLLQIKQKLEQKRKQNNSNDSGMFESQPTNPPQQPCSEKRTTVKNKTVKKQ